MTPAEIKKFVDQPLYRSISEVAGRTKTQAFIIGGFVRDLLLERPSKDIDIVVEGSGIDFAHVLSNHLQGTKVSYFKKFGTAMFVHNDIAYEIVGARKESYRYDTRKPVVEIGTLEEDRARRDFTINALSIGLNSNDFGQLIDPFNGLSDLEEGILRTPLDPDTTYSDDPLRMMRAIRFATQLNFSIEEKSWKAILEQKHRIQIVSQERITDELNKIIAAKKPSKGFKLLFDSGLLALIFPKMVELHGVEMRNGVGHKDNFYHTLKVLDNVSDRSGNLWLRWAAIMHDIAKPDTKRFDKKAGWTFHGHEDLGAKITPHIFRKLRLPMDAQMKFVQKMVRLHLRPIALSKSEVTDSGIRRLLFDAGDDLDELMILCESDITSKDDRKVKRYIQNFHSVRQKCKDVEESDKLKNWQPPIGGKEIMDTFGLNPGREVGMIKTAIREAILDGKINNDYAQARDLMFKIAMELGLSSIKTK